MFNFLLLKKVKKEELFRIFDACKPTTSDLIAYLKKFSAQSAFDLLFCNDNFVFVTREIKFNQGCLIGVRLGRFLLYAKGISATSFAEGAISRKDIFDAAAKVASRAKPLDSRLLRILKKYQAEIASLVKTLQEYDYDVSSWNQELHMIFECPSSVKFADFYKNFSIAGAIDIEGFLKNNQILVYQDNLV